MTTLEVLELRRRLAGPPAARRNPFAFAPSVEEWKPRFVTRPAVPRLAEAPRPQASLPFDGDGAQLRAKMP